MRRRVGTVAVLFAVAATTLGLSVDVVPQWGQFELNWTAIDTTVTQALAPSLSCRSYLYFVSIFTFLQ